MQRECASLLLALHAHQPFVREPNQDDCPEERTLYRALTQSYLPLLATLRRLERDHVPYALTLGFSPTLLSMLDDPLRQGRFLQYLSQQLAACDSQESLVSTHAITVHRARLLALRALYLEIGCDVAQAFAERRGVTLMTSPLSQPILPLLDRETARLQIQLAEQQHLARFGTRATGFWLPACAYTPGLEELFLHASYTFVTQQSLLHAAPRALLGPFAPALSSTGVAFFAQDPASTALLLGDNAYMHDIRYLDTSQEGDQRTGISQYCRALVDQTEKIFYDEDIAKEHIKQQAQHFVRTRVLVAQELQTRLRREPTFVLAMPMEFFGETWFEGPLFLEELFRQIAQEKRLVTLTPPQYLRQSKPLQQLRPVASSCEEEGLFSTWTQHNNLSYLAHCQRQARNILQQTPDIYAQAALRELLLAQARELLETPTEKETQRTKALVTSRQLLLMSQGKSLRDPALIQARQAQTPPWNLIWTNLAATGRMSHRQQYFG